MDEWLLNKVIVGKWVRKIATSECLVYLNHKSVEVTDVGIKNEAASIGYFIENTN